MPKAIKASSGKRILNISEHGSTIKTITSSHTKNRYVFGQMNLNRTILFQNGILIIFPSLPQNIT